jgi:hypothetical protein
MKKMFLIGKIESKKFSLNDTQIQVTGKIYGMKNKLTSKLDL